MSTPTAEAALATDRLHTRTDLAVVLAAAVAMLALWSAPAFGAPPPNASPAGAEVVPGAGPFPSLTSTVDATGAVDGGDPTSPSCSGLQDQTVWYRFTPAQGGRYVLSLRDTATAG